MATKKPTKPKTKPKANKKPVAKKVNRKRAPVAYMSASAVSDTTPPTAPHVDYAIWNIQFWHYNGSYYYQIFDDEIDTTMDLHVFGEAMPETYADGDIKVRVDTTAGVNVVAESGSAHFDPYYWPTWWSWTVAANTLAPNSTYKLKARQYQDLALATSEFSTLPVSTTPPPVR